MEHGTTGARPGTSYPATLRRNSTKGGIDALGDLLIICLGCTSATFSNYILHQNGQNVLELFSIIFLCFAGLESMHRQMHANAHTHHQTSFQLSPRTTSLMEVNLAGCKLAQNWDAKTVCQYTCQILSNGYQKISAAFQSTVCCFCLDLIIVLAVVLSSVEQSA